jgi:HD-GYP domain-containing protein (c-di-GMP phosphodiesterase class II)
MAGPHPSGTLKEAMEPDLRPRSVHEPTDVLRSAVNLAAELIRFRDADTGMHLERVSHYARLIARTLPATEGVDEEFIDDLSFLAPAHDVGKVAIPDHILLKQGVLEPDEYEIMKSHVKSGVAVVDELVRNFALGGSARVSMLRNIVRAHHEALDGSGYPDGLKGTEIPLEARIVAVADVFDALTSDRRYKQTWSQDDAFGFLLERKDTRFDAACVAALESHPVEAESIRLRFAEGAAG